MKTLEFNHIYYDKRGNEYCENNQGWSWYLYEDGIMQRSGETQVSATTPIGWAHVAHSALGYLPDRITVSPDRKTHRTWLRDEDY